MTSAAGSLSIAATDESTFGSPPVSDWQHVLGLDGLRALAVSAVLLFHGGYLQGGFLGVDLFFALSGFLITSLLLRDASGAGVRLRSFWGRRARRLLPALLALIVVVAVWAAAFGSPADVDGVRRDGPWALFYIANWHFIASAGGYWESFSQPAMFDHLWSLAIEEQFYFVWPLVIVAIWRWSRRPGTVLVATCLFGIAASVAAMVFLNDGGDPTRLYMGTDTRAASLLVGALAATEPSRRVVAALVERLGRATSWVLAIVGALVLWSWTAIDGANSAALYRGGLLVHSGLCALLVVTIAATSKSVVARALAWRPLVWVGVMSYGLYLWHWPVFVALSAERTELDGIGLFVVRIVVSTACAVASYHVVENPIRRHATWTRTGHGRQALLAGAIAVAVVAVVLGVLPTPESEIARFDPSSVAAASPSTDPATTTTTTLPTADTVGPAAAPITVASTTTAPATTTTLPLLSPIGRAVWAGDSIAYDLAPSVAAALEVSGVPIDVTAAHVGMRLIQPDNYTDLLKAVRIRLDEDQPDTIIFQLSVWDSEVDAATQLQALTALRDLVLGYGSRLVLVRGPVTDKESVNAGMAGMAAMAQQMSAEDPAHIVFLDPSDIWGAPATLDLDGDGTPERKRDFVHVCPSGAARFATWLSASLATHFAGVTPAPPTDWAGGAWVTDERYDQPVGACAPL